MNALIESVSSASSVGVDDHPDIRISPESAPREPLGADVPGVPPHAETRRATSARPASNPLRVRIPEVPPPPWFDRIVLPAAKQRSTVTTMLTELDWLTACASKLRLR